MKAYMMNGTIKEIDTSATVFDNQYITTDGDRIFDTEIKRIEDDIRLGDLYCCSKKQGTYEEVMKAIEEERSHINDCKNCFWYQAKGRVEDKCHTEHIVDGDEKTIVRTVVYKYGCKWDTSFRSEKTCVHDIDEKPQLFREVTKCFFCDHPEGVPDMTDFVKFMIDNHEKYGIMPYWSDEPISESKSFKYSKKFASYKFEKSAWSNYFNLSNARNHFKFIFDFDTKTFILCDGIGYEEVKRFETSTYDFTRKKSVSMPITGWDKFYKWFMTMVDDYLAGYKNNSNNFLLDELYLLVQKEQEGIELSEKEKDEYLLLVNELHSRNITIPFGIEI